MRIIVKMLELLDYRIPAPVTEYISYPDGFDYEVCPKCGATLERTNQAYCDRCGQCLKWIARKKMKRKYKPEQ